VELTFTPTQSFGEPHKKERWIERGERCIEEGGELPTHGLGVSLLLARGSFI
jgi:hypothetical protein